MRSRSTLHVLPLVCVAALTLGLSAPGLAHAQSAASTQSSIQLTAPTELDLELAKRSLAPPITETVFGGVVIGASPLVGLFAAVMAGSPVVCLEDGGCEAERKKGRAAGLGAGIASAAIGLGMIAHGAYRIQRIRQARRLVSAAPSASFELERARVGLRLRWAF